MNKMSLLNDLLYLQEGKSEYLEGLLEATKELSHIDRSNIFYHLLVTYCKADETDKALGLWTLLQEEGEVPSDNFLTYLGNHLKSKNRDIPFVMPETEVTEVHTQKPTLKVQKKYKELQKPTKNEISDHIEKLTQEGKTTQAIDYAMKNIEEGIVPKANVMKFLLKNLAEDGNVEKIQPLGKLINENMKRNVTYDDKLTLAIFVRGAGMEHMDNILKVMENSDSNEEIEAVLRRFPRSNALAAAVQNSELSAKCMYNLFIIISCSNVSKMSHFNY